VKVEAFSRTYDEARTAFREAARAIDADTQEYRIDVPNYEGALAINIASFGDPQPSWALVVSTGLHGVEGFFGSQFSWLTCKVFAIVNTTSCADGMFSFMRLTHSGSQLLDGPMKTTWI
jgi:hypothetical protein